MEPESLPVRVASPPATRVLAFLVVASVLSSLLHFYLASRLGDWPAWPPPLGAVLTVLIWIGAALVPLGLISWRFVGRERARWLSWGGLSWMGSMYYLVFGLLPFELLRALAPASAAVDVARIAALTVTSLTLVLTIVGRIRVARGPVVVRVIVPVPDLPRALDGLTIAHLSDIHLGPTIGQRELIDIVERTRELHPDLVAITGDLVDGDVPELARDVAVLAELKAPLGVFFVTGNHEYYSGHEAWLAHLPTLGVTVLRNSRVRVSHAGASLDVAGVPDVQGRRFGDAPDLARALHGRDATTPLIVLAHQPKQAMAAAERGAMLVLSGHTHAGQLAPFGIFARIGQPSLRGLFALHPSRRSWLYTSEGTGYWGPPMRIGTRSEIAFLTLVRAPAG